MIRNALNFIKGLIRNDPAVNQKTDAYLRSVRFFLPVGILTVLSNWLGLDLVAYTLCAAVAVWVCLRGSDLLPLIALIPVCYIVPSRENNPGRNPDSIFSLTGGGIWMLILALAIAAAIGWRIWKDQENWRRQSFRLLPGMIGLSISYALGGIFSPAWFENTLSHLLFALIQAACLIVPYLLFSAEVEWKRVRRDWFGWLGCMMGAILLCELLWIYLFRNVISEGSIVRKEIYSGWGMYNNFGCMLLMMLPFPFYLGRRYNKELYGLLGGAGIFAAILLSSSRNAILLGSMLFVFCVLRTLSLTADRRRMGKIVGFAALGILAAAVLLWKPLTRLFQAILEQGLDMNSRENIYAKGVAYFEQYPIFGVSFFPPGYRPWSWSTNDSFTGFFPGRWHNTLVQLLATGGLVSLAAYCWHRCQTVFLFRDHSRREEVFSIAVSMTAFLASSFFDCHFFNVGPTLFYSLALAFSERIVKSQISLRKR